MRGNEGKPVVELTYAPTISRKRHSLLMIVGLCCGLSEWMLVGICALISLSRWDPPIGKPVYIFVLEFCAFGAAVSFISLFMIGAKRYWIGIIALVLNILAFIMYFVAYGQRFLLTDR